MKRISFIVLAVFFVTFVSAQKFTEIKTSQIPKKASEYLKKNLNSYSVLRAAQSTEKGITKYAVVAETSGRKAIYVFDKDGNFLDRVKSMQEAENVKVPAPATPSGTTKPSGKKIESSKAEPAKK